MLVDWLMTVTVMVNLEKSYLVSSHTFCYVRKGIVALSATLYSSANVLFKYAVLLRLRSSFQWQPVYKKHIEKLRQTAT